MIHTKEPAIVRRMKLADNPMIANIIRTVMPEFGASGPGFAIHDPEVADMFGSYTRPRCAYFVCVMEGSVLGGAGIAPLENGPDEVCELKKMYFLPEARGTGMGQSVLTSCLTEARNLGFRYCYLETFNTMVRAMKFYERNHFRRIPGPMGNTGHFACDTFYKLEL